MSGRDGPVSQAGLFANARFTYNGVAGSLVWRSGTVSTACFAITDRCVCPRTGCGRRGGDARISERAGGTGGGSQCRASAKPRADICWRILPRRDLQPIEKGLRARQCVPNGECEHAPPRRQPVDPGRCRRHLFWHPGEGRRPQVAPIGHWPKVPGNSGGIWLHPAMCWVHLDASSGFGSLRSDSGAF